VAQIDRFWPEAVLGDVENCANSMATFRRIADVHPARFYPDRSYFFSDCLDAAIVANGCFLPEADQFDLKSEA
jgi:hypothetical protein